LTIGPGQAKFELVPAPEPGTAGAVTEGVMSGQAHWTPALLAAVLLAGQTHWMAALLAAMLLAGQTQVDWGSVVVRGAVPVDVYPRE
jgi:hypothetical protein